METQLTQAAEVTVLEPIPDVAEPVREPLSRVEVEELLAVVGKEASKRGKVTRVIKRIALVYAA
ncbi:MAG: hypothetical protein LC723_14820, partial [Actinobacteria bacterium]|nr:hypothetical protein [Actinomycetota bacterium]